jgi:hypothetical protein
LWVHYERKERKPLFTKKLRYDNHSFRFSNHEWIQFEWVALNAVKPNNSNNLGEMVSLDKLEIWIAFYVQQVQNFILEKCGKVRSFLWELLKTGYMYCSRYNKYYSDAQSREFLAGVWLQVSIFELFQWMIATFQYDKIGNLIVRMSVALLKMLLHKCNSLLDTGPLFNLQIIFMFCRPLALHPWNRVFLVQHDKMNQQ